MVAAKTTKNTQLSITEIYKESWSVLTNRFSEFLPILGLMIVSGVLNVVGDKNSNPFLGLASGLLQIAIGYVVMWGTMQVVRNKKADLISKFQDFSGMWKYFIVSLVVGLLSGLGLILLIVPGIYLLLKYGFAGLVNIDKGTGIGASMEEASKLTSGRMGSILLFMLATIGINIVGGLLFGLGLVVTIPLTQLSVVVLYERLRK